MRESIKTKLFTLCILLVLTTSIIISIPFFLLTKHDKQTASQIRIHVAFEIIRKDVLNRINNYSVQIDELIKQVSAIPWGLKWYSEIGNKKAFFSSSTYSSYIITIGEEFQRFSHLIPADRLSLYGIDRRLLVSYHRMGNNEQIGTYIVAPDGQNHYLSIDNYSQFLIQQKAFFQTTLPKNFTPEFYQEFPAGITSQHFKEDTRLGLRIIAPVFHRASKVGVLVAEMFYTQNMVKDYAELSKTQVNVFVDDKLSVGTLPAQQQLNVSEATGIQSVTHNELLQLGKITNVSTMTIAKKKYYQGKYDFTDSKGIPVGAITASLSKENETLEIRRVLLVTIAISLLAISATFVITIILSRKTILSINNLTRTTSAIANGNLQEPIDTRGKDELGVLAKSFVKMQQSINDQLNELNNEITERKQAEKALRDREKEKASLEKQLNQAQKMEAIGTLAGGIAHDFNNILSVILGYSDMLKRRLEKDASSSKSLDQIIKAGNRAKNLVSQILAFSRKNSKELIIIQPDLIVKETLELLHATIPSTIKITHIIQKCGQVIADPTQLHQVVLNLCTNAYHAMRETNGELTISLKSIQLENSEIKTLSLPLQPGSYIELKVSDTGHGMDQITQLKIFDPYFTTKAQGDGTGLGLAVVHGVIKSFNGHISVNSMLGKGTTFSVYLPQVEEGSILNEEKYPQPIPTGTEHILLVDDDKSVLQIEREMLEGLGYRVTSTDNSPTALELFQQKPGIFSLVITDMTMPDMNGVELIAKLRNIQHDIPIILCSGFSELVDDIKAKNIGINKYLMKPVLLKDIAEAVRETIDETVS